jgi:competence protein ComEA
VRAPGSRRPPAADARRWLPSGGAIAKGVALAASLAFMTLVGLRAGPAGSAPVALAASPPGAPNPGAPAIAAAGPASTPAVGGAPGAAPAVGRGPTVGGAAGATPSPSGGSAASDGAAPSDPSPGAAGGVLPDGRVVLNVAGEQDLTRLPGIGPARAKAIVALRSRLGRFRSLTDLRRVKGIGPRSLERMRAHAVLDAPT